MTRAHSGFFEYSGVLARKIWAKTQYNIYRWDGVESSRRTDAVTEVEFDLMPRHRQQPV